ncbi:MAG: sporulation protein YtfJ [Clostridia bacterium]|nr:sporulation protein YtfJ [Clostridia bacterium]
MSEYNERDYFNLSLDGVGRIADSDTVIGKPITTANGVTVIPVSKVTMGFLNAGVDYGSKKLTGAQTAGGGGGTGLSITPLAFLTVSPDAEIKLISLNGGGGGIDKVVDLIDRSPQIVERIKDALL